MIPAFARELMRREKVNPAIVIDCSHANSGKKHEKQHCVFEDVLAQINAGEHAIKGMMLESYLKPGKQKICADCPPDPAIGTGYVMGQMKAGSLLT